MRLASAGNVFVPAILLLEERGYAVTCARNSDGETWMAKRAHTEFVADDPLQLLGLASLGEARGPSWHATDAEIQATLTRFGM